MLLQHAIPICSAVLAVLTTAVSKEKPWVIAAAGVTAAAASRLAVLSARGNSRFQRIFGLHASPTSHIPRRRKSKFGVQISNKPFKFHPSRKLIMDDMEELKLKERDLDYFRVFIGP
ncbi:hypothetical protein HDV05_006522, partial [Chytridiales sp. JEL 0842]